MKSITEYESFDGKRFSTAEECRAYEDQHFETRLTGLTLDEVRAALAREDTDLADAFEKAGNLIGRARREAGELRKTRRPKAAESEPATDAEPEVDAQDEAEAA